MANISKLKVGGISYNVKDTVSGYATVNYVDTQIGAIKGFDVIICSSNADTPKGVVWAKDGEKYVGTLEAADAAPRTFYMVYQENGAGIDYYDEYLAIGVQTKSWEKVGNTHIDLSNYYTKAEVNALGQTIMDQVSAEATRATGKEAELLAAINALTARVTALEPEDGYQYVVVKIPELVIDPEE